MNNKIKFLVLSLLFSQLFFMGCDVIKEKDIPKLIILKLNDLNTRLSLNDTQYQNIKNIYINEIKDAIEDRDKYKYDFDMLVVTTKKEKMVLIKKLKRY